MNPLWPGWAYLFAAVVVGGGIGGARVIAAGRRRWLAERENPLRIWTRIVNGKDGWG